MQGMMQNNMMQNNMMQMQQMMDHMNQMSAQMNGINKPNEKHGTNAALKRHDEFYGKYERDVW